MSNPAQRAGQPACAQENRQDRAEHVAWAQAHTALSAQQLHDCNTIWALSADHLGWEPQGPWAHQAQLAGSRSCACKGQVDCSWEGG